MRPILAILLLASCGHLAGKSTVDARAAGAPPAVVVADGNSLTRGSCASSNAKTYPSDLAAFGYTVVNAGVGSQTTEGMAATAATNVDLHFEPTGVLVAWEGHNSWRLTFESADAAYGAMTGYVTDRHKVGWRVFVMTAIPSAEDGQPDGWEAWRAAYNVLVLANGASAEGTVDLTDDRLADPAGPYFCQDHVHLSDAGYSVVAEHVAKALATKE